MTKAEEYLRSEGQYLDIVDFIVNHPNTEITASAYLAWSHRSDTVDWGATTQEGVAQRVLSRLEHIALAVLLPQRPDKASPARNSVWLQELLRQGGAFYRAKRGTYVLDTAAAWRRTANGVALTDNRWTHYPTSGVRRVMPNRTQRVEPARRQDPETLRDLTPDVPDVDVVAADNKSPDPVAVRTTPTYTVEAAGAMIGDQIVLRRVDENGKAVLLLAQVSSVIQAVAS